MVPEPTRIRFLKENYHTIQKDGSITNRNSICGSEFRLGVHALHDWERQ